MKVTWRVFLGSPLTSSYAVSGEAPHVPPASVSAHCILTVRKTVRDGASAKAGDHTAEGSGAHFLVQRGSASLLYFMPVFALMLKPFCTLDNSRPSPVQWATTTSVRTLAHIVTNSLKSSITNQYAACTSPGNDTSEEGRGCLLFHTTRTFHMKLFPWSPKSHILHACVPLCTGRREGEGHESTTQSKGTFSRTECE